MHTADDNQSEDMKELESSRARFIHLQKTLVGIKTWQDWVRPESLSPPDSSKGRVSARDAEAAKDLDEEE